MDLEFDDHQIELRDAARELLAKECPPATVRAVNDGTGDELADRLWKVLGSLDWPVLTIPEVHGGMGMTPVDLAIVCEELGYVAEPTPFVATTSQFVPVVAHCGDEAQRSRFLGEVAAGGTGTLAAADATGRWDPAAPPVPATRSGDGWRLDGTACFVVDGDRADRIAVLASTDEGPVAVVVPAGAADVRRTPSFDPTLHLAEVCLDGVEVDDDACLRGGPDGAARAVEEATTAMALVVVGACQRALDLVLAYVRDREQFGVPIGSFQAVKGKAVDMYVAIERARALGWFAALTAAEDDARRSLAASMASAAASEAQRLVFQHAIQLFGGIGFTWENDVHLYLRRAKAASLLFGTAEEHRARIGGGTLAARGRGDRRWAGVKLSFDEETEAFRAEFSQWLDENLPDPSETTERPRSTAHVPEWSRRWQAKLFDAGWLVPGNPPEYGGRNAGLLEMFVHTEELVRRGIVASMNPQGLSIVAPSILSFGTEEQKRRWAAPLLRADLTAALGMSEPNAGSDLAGLRTRAVLDGDDFVVTGQKVWTSGAHDADFILAFVRTDPDVPKHRGISALVVPTDTPGVERKPFGSIVAADDLDFNEVFFDEARVPRENLIGPLNGGWGVANGSLGHERAMLWLGYSERLETFLDSFAGHVGGTERAGDPRLVDWYAGVAMDAMALKLLGYRTLAQTRRGTPSREQSILKLFGSEASQDAYGDALEHLGAEVLDTTVLAGVYQPMRYDSMNQGWFDHYLRTFAGTIAGGTSEIQRNIIAEHVLGLPR